MGKIGLGLALRKPKTLILPRKDAHKIKTMLNTIYMEHCKE